MVKKLKDILVNSKNIVAFTGAGVSTESNIPDFRSSGGIFETKTKENIPPEKIVSKTFFDENPEMFYDFYRKTLIYKNAKPNNCHLALAKLEQMGNLKCVITQNIDGLHQKAGSKNVIELHGNVRDYYCINCGKKYNEDYFNMTTNVPRCNCSGIIRPDVILYEEMLDHDKLINSLDFVEKADVLLVIGTSLLVYPANTLVSQYLHKQVIIINKGVTQFDRLVTLRLFMSAGEAMKEILDM